MFTPATFRMRYCDGCRGKCSVEGCDSAVKAHRLCGMHLWRSETHGDPGAAEKHNLPQTGLCSVEGCELPSKTKGYCSSHYSRVRVHGVAGSAKISKGKPKGVPCEVEGCYRPSDGDGLCRMHYERRRNTGVLGGPEPVRNPSGEGCLTPQGYRIITVDGKTILEHRHVMQQVLGRPLRADEVVHHRDGQRARNTPDNLELWSKAHPPGQRVVDKIAWAINLLGEYPGLVQDAGYRLEKL